MCTVLGEAGDPLPIGSSQPFTSLKWRSGFRLLPGTTPSCPTASQSVAPYASIRAMAGGVVWVHKSRERCQASGAVAGCIGSARPAG